MAGTSHDNPSRLMRVVNMGTARLENLYWRVTKDQPESPRSLHVKSILAMQNGRHDEAARLIGQAAVLDPADADHQRQLGTTCFASRLAGACRNCAEPCHISQSFRPGTLVHSGSGVRCCGKQGPCQDLLRAMPHPEPALSRCAHRDGRDGTGIDHPYLRHHDPTIVIRPSLPRHGC